MIFLIGAGPWQYSMYSILLHSGLKICTVSPSSAGFGDSLHISADVRDRNGIISEIERLKLTPSFFVSSQTDLTVGTVAYLNWHYGLGTEQNTTAKIFTNKLKMRSRLADLSVKLKNPSFIGASADELETVISALQASNKPPFVIKPASLQSSLGVTKVEKFSEFSLEEYRRDLVQYDIDEFILEEMICGREYTIEGYKKKNGDHVILAASEKEKKFGFGIANALHYGPEALELCLSVERDLSALFAIYEYGPTHTEVIVTSNGEFYLVEAAVRGGGSGIPSEVVPTLTGFFPEYELLRDACIATPEPPTFKKKKYVSLVFYEFKANFATELVYNQDYIVRHWCDYSVGDLVRPIQDDRSRHGFVIVGGESKLHISRILSHLIECNPSVVFHD